MAITGGIITVVGSRTYHTFSNVGSESFISDVALTVDVLVIAGGGGASMGGGGRRTWSTA